MATILIVEDEKTLADVLGEKLKEEGMTVETAEDGQLAIDFFKAGKTVDLILLDILLPKVDGFTVLKTINEMGVKVPPVIILSNFLHDEEEEKARKLGAKEFLVKAAYSTTEVVSKIREVLGAPQAA